MLWCHASLKNPETKKAKFTIDDAGFRCKYGGHTSINHTGITTLTRVKQGSMVALYAILVLLSSSSLMVPANFLRKLRPKHICTYYVLYLRTYPELKEVRVRRYITDTYRYRYAYIRRYSKAGSTICRPWFTVCIIIIIVTKIVLSMCKSLYYKEIRCIQGSMHN